MPESKNRDALVIGAGSAGLGVAGELVRRGVPTTLLEQSDGVAASWRSRYPDLRLNTDRWVSGLPGVRIPASAGRWPGRDSYISYLEHFADQRQLQMRFGVRVQRVDRTPVGWSLDTSVGTLSAPFVIVCTGHDRVPYLPDWEGVATYGGELLHAAQFQSAADFSGKSVLVVGMGTSATEIAARLAPLAAVRVAVRTTPNLMPAQFLGLPITVYATLFERAPVWLTDRAARIVARLTVGDLGKLGLEPPPFGIATEIRVKGMGPVVDRGFTAAVRAGRIELVPALDAFRDGTVLLADGRTYRPDAIIAATGYRAGLEQLVGHLGILDGNGLPLVTIGRCIHAAPGLFFNGYGLPLSGELPSMRRSARRIAKEIAAQRRSRP